MFEKSWQTALFLVLLVCAMVTAGILTGDINTDTSIDQANQVYQGDVCYNRYCYEFQWTCCCVEEKGYFNYLDFQNYIPSKSATPPTCPSGGDVKWCDVNVEVESYNIWDWSCMCNRQTPEEWFIGSGNCYPHKEGWWIWEIERWKCDTETKHAGDASTVILKPGEKIYTWENAYASATGFVNRYVLLDTGKAGSCVGVEVEGTIGCTYAKDYISGYDDYGNMLAGVQKLDESRCIKTTTEADKRVCGSTCDTCIDDWDCASRYPQQVNWGGRMLGSICTGKELHLYGCGVPIGSSESVCMTWEDLNNNKIHDYGEPCSEYRDKKECTLTKRLTTGIECCTSDDCSLSNQYCDWYETFKSRCVLEKECTKDSDCGTMVECDSYEKTITEPYCTPQGLCDKKIIDHIECCGDSDCPTLNGQVQECVQNQCVTTGGKTKCPFGCCTDLERENLYIGGVCPEGYQCCAGDHICREDCGSVLCDEDGVCEAGETSECSDCFDDDPDDPCGFECDAMDFECLFDKKVICPLTVAVNNLLVWVGVIAIVLVIILIIIAVLKAKIKALTFAVPRPRMPPRHRRGYYA